MRKVISVRLKLGIASTLKLITLIGLSVHVGFLVDPRTLIAVYPTPFG